MIYTFYSYKGGAGSSMALANVAKWYYLRGLRVVMIDWDLEAPGGLENFFYEQQDQLERVRSRLGLIDMLQDYKQQFPLLPRPSGAQLNHSENEEITEQAKPASDEQTIAQILRKYLPPLSGMLYRVEPFLSDETDGPALWLLPAGWRSGDRFVDYAQAVERFDWTEFYTGFEGQAYFEWMREQLEAYADVVLIDSRSGFNEMSVVCTQHMADVVVSFCAPNFQNLYGTFIMVQSFKRPEIFEARGRPLEVVVVPSRIDNSELGIRNIFEARFKELFNNDKFTPAVFSRSQHTFLDLRIPYVPKYAYSEKLAVGDPEGAAELMKAYNDLAVHLVMLAPAEHILRKRCESDLQLVATTVGSFVSEGGTGKATLLEIQELVDKAQRKIEEGDRDSVETVLWPDIKSKLGLSTELEWSYREDMKRLIYKGLNEQKLHAAPRRINLVELRRRLKQGKAKAPETEHRHYWIPW